jgi:major membrane immunogen (membrane-anchored lipoprotein)
MKKTFVGLVFAMCCAAALSAQTYRDGFYFGQDAEYTQNQKNQVVLEVKGGKIASAKWNILSLNAGAQDLKSIAQAGKVAAAATWAAQAGTTEAFLVSSQNVNAASVPNGPANVKPFFDLVKKALAASPVAKGSYKDGWYYSEAAAADEYHTKNTVLLTVVNGTLVDVLWNGILQGMPSSVNPSKMITSRANGYPMTGSKSAWHLQSAASVAELLKVQNPDSLKVKANGTPDAIAGVSIQIKPLVDVAKAALQSAK